MRTKTQTNEPIPFSFTMTVRKKFKGIVYEFSDLLVEGWVEIVRKRPRADVDDVYHGTKEMKGTLEALGATKIIKAEANNHVKQLFNNQAA